MKPTLRLYHDTRKPKKSGLYPVKIRLTYQRESKYFPVGLDLNQQEFAQVQSRILENGINGPAKRLLKEYILTIDAFMGNASRILAEMRDFNFSGFERQLKGFQPKQQDLFQYFSAEIELKESAGNVGTASNYRCSMNSLHKFRPKLKFRDVSVEVLNEYQNWLLGEGKSISTVGIYLRPLRAVLIKAIDEGVFSPENYPFGKRKFQIPACRNVKKALTKEEIKLLFDYKGIPGTWWQKARDIFIFSYLAHGMNMKDIALLRNENIDGKFIRYSRAKTQLTNRSSRKPISISINGEMEEIINRWRTGSKKSDDRSNVLKTNVLPPISSGFISLAAPAESLPCLPKACRACRKLAEGRLNASPLLNSNACTHWVIHPLFV